MVAAKEKLLQIFSQVHGQALYQSRFDYTFMLATHKNPTAKTLSEEIEWELSAFDKVKQKVNKTIKAVRESVKKMRQ